MLMGEDFSPPLFTSLMCANLTPKYTLCVLDFPNAKERQLSIISSCPKESLVASLEVSPVFEEAKRFERLR
jgi:hypothetical protein